MSDITEVEGLNSRNNRLLLIGNGFDLAHGLPTSYNQFLKWWLDNTIRRFTSKVENKNWDDRSLDISDKLPPDPLRTYPFPSDRNLENIENIFSPRIYQWKNQLLKHIIISNNINGWVDIEKFYFNQLRKILIDGETIDGEIGLTDHEKIDNVNELNKNLESITFLLSTYIKEVSQDRGTLRKSYYRYFKDFNHRDLAINFNYTHTPDQYIDLDLIKRVISIHGSAIESNSEIIFGYGNENDKYYKQIEELDDNRFLEHIKSFKYALNDNYQKIENFLQIPFDVDIFGLSCGSSDGVLLSTIFNHSNCKKIHIRYHEDPSKYIDTYMNISRHFNDKERQRRVVQKIDPAYKV